MSKIMTPRRIAQSGLIMSTVVSVEFNVLGTMIQTDSITAMITNAVWSGMALVGAEIMCRGKIPAKRRGAKHNPWAMIKFGGVGVVALLSMILTFGHGHDLMIHWGSAPLQAIMAPVAVDAMMILSGLMVLVSPAPARRRQARKPVRKLRAA